MIMTDSEPLTRLVPSTPLLLAYALPLLLVSILLTFAGAFLILDRTRSFPPSYDVVPGAFEPKKRPFYSIEGGVGGLAVGFVCGVHLSTFLSLLIPAVTPSAPHTPASFMSVWILSASLTSAIGGRWKHAALALAGISGGALIALFLAVVMHPPLITRVILGGILTPTFAAATLVPHDRFQHASLRIATSATGTFGIILAIALLAHISAWANVWQRWWVPHNSEWGSGKEKGLTAAFFMIFIVGFACDWFLHWKFGACPDEKWDRYLSTYAVNLPDRAGTFRPLESVWGRLFRRNNESPTNDTLLPSSRNLFQRLPTSMNQGRLHPKPRIRTSFGKMRGTVKFKSFNDVESACSSDSEDPVLDAKSQSSATPVEQKPSLDLTDSDKTLDGDSQHIQSAAPNMSIPASSVTSPDRYDAVGANRDHDEKQSQNPRFLADDVASFTLSTTPPRQLCLPSDSSPLGAVPATPSLIKALDRVASAQQHAFRNLGTSMTENFAPFGADAIGGHKFKKRYNGFEWDDFWKDVKIKVRHDRHD